MGEWETLGAELSHTPFLSVRLLAQGQEEGLLLAFTENAGADFLAGTVFGDEGIDVI